MMPNNINYNDLFTTIKGSSESEPNKSQLDKGDNNVSIDMFFERASAKEKIIDKEKM